MGNKFMDIPLKILLFEHNFIMKNEAEERKPIKLNSIKS